MFPHPVISCLNERLDPHRAGSTIALAIHSFEGISIAFANRSIEGISIAFANRSVEGISIAFANRSVDPAGAFRGWCAGDLYRPP